jgi:hypothetical protein
MPGSRRPVPDAVDGSPPPCDGRPGPASCTRSWPHPARPGAKGFGAPNGRYRRQTVGTRVNNQHTHWSGVQTTRCSGPCRSRTSSTQSRGDDGIQNSPWRNCGRMGITSPLFLIRGWTTDSAPVAAANLVGSVVVIAVDWPMSVPQNEGHTLGAMQVMSTPPWGEHGLLDDAEHRFRPAETRPGMSRIVRTVGQRQRGVR